jgi:hypothetical protein
MHCLAYILNYIKTTKQSRQIKCYQLQYLILQVKIMRFTEVCDLTVFYVWLVSKE